MAWNTGVGSRKAWIWYLAHMTPNRFLRCSGGGGVFSKVTVLEHICDLNRGTVVSSRRMGPANMHALIPATWEHGTPPDGRDLKDVIQLRIWRWGDHSALLGWAQCNHRRP